jgi:hypothetical protein
LLATALEFGVAWLSTEVLAVPNSTPANPGPPSTDISRETMSAAA